MANEQLFITMALSAWDMQIKRASKALDTLSNEQMLEEVASGKNRAVYIFGHLLAVHDAMFPLLGLGESTHPELKEIFITRPDKATPTLPSMQDLRQYWIALHAKLSEQFRQLTVDQWFSKHSDVSAEDFAKEPHRNKLNILLSRTSHVAYHLGQIILLKK